jgi:hypothetical protein
VGHQERLDVKVSGGELGTDFIQLMDHLVIGKRECTADDGGDTLDV